MPGRLVVSYEGNGTGGDVSTMLAFPVIRWRSSVYVSGRLVVVYEGDCIVENVSTMVAFQRISDFNNA